MGMMLEQRAELVDDIWHACRETATVYNVCPQERLDSAVLIPEKDSC